MSNSIPRRYWLKQSALAIAGLSFADSLLAKEKQFIRPVAGAIRLNANENPYGPSPLARKAMADAVIQSNRYPWDITTRLRERIAGHFSLTKEHVLMGAGSSEILGLVAIHKAIEKGNMVGADPTFRIWWAAVERMGIAIIKVPLTPDKNHDLPKMLRSMNSQTKLVYICNPNNPTGTIVPTAQLKDFVEEASKKALVLLDEAYTEYAGEPSLAPLVANNKNLVIAKTFSKIYGLAGARVGYALAHPDTIKQLNDLQPWANAGPSTVSLVGALASLDDAAFIESARKNNITAKELTYAAFSAAQIPFIPSHTNFVYYSVQKYPGDFQAYLNSNNIVIGRTVEETGKWVRTSIGTIEEMQQFAGVIKQAFNS